MKRIFSVAFAALMVMVLCVNVFAVDAITFEKPIKMGIYVHEGAPEQAVDVTGTGSYTFKVEGLDVKGAQWLIIKNTDESGWPPVVKPSTVPDGAIIRITELKINGEAVTFAGESTYDYEVKNNGVIEINIWNNFASSILGLSFDKNATINSVDATVVIFKDAAEAEAGVVPTAPAAEAPAENDGALYTFTEYLVNRSETEAFTGEGIIWDLGGKYFSFVYKDKVALTAADLVPYLVEGNFLRVTVDGKFTKGATQFRMYDAYQTEGGGFVQTVGEPVEEDGKVVYYVDLAELKAAFDAAGYTEVKELCLRVDEEVTVYGAEIVTKAAEEAPAEDTPAVDDTPVEETPAETGLTLAVLPAVIALAVVAFKKR